MNTRVYFYVAAAVVFLCCSARAKAQNDLCSQAIPINCPSATSGTTVGATLDNGLPICFGPSPANGGNLTVTAPGVWYLLTGSGLTVTADTLVAAYDTKISVYTGLNCSALTCVTADDDIQGSPFHSKVAFQTQPGALYWIMVHGFNTATGTFTLNVQCDPTPPNDNCATAQPIGDGAFSGTTIGATGERFDPTSSTLASCATNGNHPVFDVWYDYLASCSGSLTVNTCGAFDTLLSVHSLCPTNTVGNQLTPVASTCNDNGPAGCTPGSQLLTVPVTSGVHYRIRVAGAIGANSGGSFLLNTGCISAPPANDPCSGAIVISGSGTINGTTNNATNDGVSSCGAPGLPDVWYSYTTPATCGPFNLSFSTCGTLDTVLTAYTGACGALAELGGGCNDNCGGTPCSGPGSCVSIPGVPASTVVRIRVASVGSGTFTLTFAGASLGAPPNDLCGTATPVIEGTHPFSNTCASTDGIAFTGGAAGCDPTDSATNCNSDVWFLYTATCTAATNVSTCNAGTLTDTVLVVYPASGVCPPSDASKLACDDDIDLPFTCGISTLRSAVTFNAVAGSQYLIRVGSFSTVTQGTGAVTISQPPNCTGVTIPPGDDCFHTTCGSTMYEFKNTPIPCGFFDPGSEPFDGTVLLGGDPANASMIDTRVRRLSAASVPQNPPGTAQVPIELVALSLVSCQPITVRYCNSPNVETWNVIVNLSPAPSPPGIMTINKTHPNGGDFTSQFFVRPVFTFIRANPPATRQLGVNPVLQPVQLNSTTPAPWVHNLNNLELTPSCALPGANFFPGVQEGGQSTPGSTCVPTVQCPKQVGHAGPGHLHVTGYVNVPCPCGACCNPVGGICIEVSSPNPGADCAALFGGTGVYKGDGTSCASTDGDAIPDSYEGNRPCAGGNCATNTSCTAHTDPTRGDSDGDGVPDDADPAPWNPCIPSGAPTRPAICDNPAFDHVAPLGDGICRSDGICNLCAIALGLSLDCNGNGVPDECECALQADMNADGLRNGLDVQGFANCYVAGPSIQSGCPIPTNCACSDMNSDGVVTLPDVVLFSNAVLTGP